MNKRLPPSATAIRWFLIAKGEVEYRSQAELAEAIGLDYATLKHGLSILREQNALERVGTKRVKLKDDFA